MVWPRPIISVAPMVDCTDRHYRYLMRLISKNILLYTPMITTGALLYGNAEKILRYDSIEQPLVLQLGGSDPQALAECAKIAAAMGYAEINLNVGCPSERVKRGRFGACLMLKPQLVADCVAAMQRTAAIPITVKTRIGVDEYDDYEYFRQFIARVAQAGCQLFIIHARKAWLKGLNPKQNREIPPLRYDYVYQLKKDFPHLWLEINGGLNTRAQVIAQLKQIDSVMIGRAAYTTPWFVSELRDLLHDDTNNSCEQVYEGFLSYIERELRNGTKLMEMVRHLFGLFHGRPGARLWRRSLSENGHQPGANLLTLRNAYLHLLQ